ncbi:MAG TPA: hypothetical protein VJU77_18855 [Chthoniobacterales bacterium]|nr:hypothetical protein [Chthoniobacterales bacterium]
MKAGKRTPALVLVDLPGDDVILFARSRSRARSDGSSVALDPADFGRGKLNQTSSIRPQRLFTVEQSMIVYSAGKVKGTKLAEVLANVQTLFA